MYSITAIGGTSALSRYLAAPRTAPAGEAFPASNVAAGERVTISAEARATQRGDAAAKSAGIPLPQSVRDWFDKDFSDDVLAEAAERLAAIREEGRLGAEGPLGLPLLPENQVLLDGFREEMRTLSADGHANMDETAAGRFNLLMNLSMRLQLQGWQTPMHSEADVQREFDIANAMARLVRDNPDLAPAEEEEPATWQARWQEAGLEMPAMASTPLQSFWLQLADSAGIGEDEFMNAVRDLAGRHAGHELTGMVEKLIAERYAGLRNAEGA